MTYSKWPLKAITVGSSLCTGGWRWWLTLFSPVLMTKCSSRRASALSFNCCHLWCWEGHYQRKAEWKTLKSSRANEQEEIEERDEAACTHIHSDEPTWGITSVIFQTFYSLTFVVFGIIPLGDNNLAPTKLSALQCGVITDILGALTFGFTSKESGLDNLDKTCLII